MRLSVVGWATDSGVGRELIDALRNLPVSSAFIVQSANKPTRRDLLTVPHLVAPGLDIKREMEAFIEKFRPDTILTWEWPGSWAFPPVWAKRGVRWIHVVHWDWFAPDHRDAWRQAVLLAPNRMCKAELKGRHGLESILLPVPVDTKRFAFRQRTRATEFISVYGYGGSNDRRSMGEILSAWTAMAKPPRLTILAQKEPAEAAGLRRVTSIRIKVGNAPEPCNLYEFGDVAVQPSRYEGIGISMLEAQAAGIPVIAIDAPPMNEVAPDLLVPSEKTSTIDLMGQPLVSHTPSVKALGRRVESLNGEAISELSKRARMRVEKEYSWTVLGPRWHDVLKGT